MTDGLVAALARAQGKFPAITKGHTNPHFKSKYADLSDVLAAVRPVLSAEGIAVLQPIRTHFEGQVVFLHTILAGHGETLESSMPLHMEGMTPQQLGSTLTYYRRYALASMLGVAAEDDDDGNAAQTAPRPPARQQTTVATGDPYALAAASPPEKPLAAMTAGEMARYGESIGIRVSGNKTDILRTLEPYVMAATGEPFDVTTNAPVSEGAVGKDVTNASTIAEEQPEFSPVVAGAGTLRKSVNSAMKAADE